MANLTHLSGWVCSWSRRTLKQFRKVAHLIHAVPVPHGHWKLQVGCTSKEFVAEQTNWYPHHDRVPSECAAECQQCMRTRLQRPEWRWERSSIRITNQSAQRLFKWIEKATRSQTLGCFLLHDALPSPAFKCMPVSLQTKIIRALRSFKQSKMWSLCGCCINKWMALPTLKKSNIRCAWGS